MDRTDAIKQCICKMCPSYFDCQELIAYCLAQTGKSVCITVEQGCICPGCPVQEKMLFRNQYYCTRGNEKEQEAV